MKGDAGNYGRASGVSLLGGVLQFLMAVGLAIYAAYSGGDHAAVTAAVYAALGLAVWLTLALLYDFHRRERLEAVEAERMAQEDAASAFETSGEELRVAARRLGAVNKAVLPIVSLSLGASMVAVGATRFGSGSDLFDPDNFSAGDNRGWAVAIGLSVAFVGFVFARFVAGMAKQRIWSSLRAGGSYAVGTALLGLAIAVAHFLDLALSNDVGLRALPAAFAVFLIVMGAEIGLNFVLDIYRPRKPGEDPRPAFDSRILGLLAAPDKIAENVGEALNYQLGVRVTETWFYSLVSRWWPAFLAGAVLVVWGMTAFVVVEPHQRAIILRNGRIANADAGPGLHLKWPWPLGEVAMPQTVLEGEDGEQIVIRTATGVRKIHLGTNPPEEGKAILWTNQHVQEEIPNLVQPMRYRSTLGLDSGVDDERDPVTDLSLVAIEAPVHYVVDDALRYELLAQPGHRQTLLEAVGQRTLTQFLGSVSIDQVLGGERLVLAQDIGRLVTAAFETLQLGAESGSQALDEDGVGVEMGAGAGVEVIFVGTGGVHPLREVAPNFERVVQADQNRQALIEEAQRDMIRTLAQVAGSADAAREIAEALDSLEALQAGGADRAAIVQAELEVQRLVERAGGEAGSLLLAASADRWARHMGERGRAALFEGQLASYEAAPELYRTRLYLSAMSDVISDARVFLVSGELRDAVTRIELKSKDTGVDIFDPEAGEGLQ